MEFMKYIPFYLFTKFEPNVGQNMRSARMVGPGYDLGSV